MLPSYSIPKGLTQKKMNKNTQALSILLLSVVKVYLNSRLITIIYFHSGNNLSKYKKGLLNGKQMILRLFKFLSSSIETKF